jgi:hypothetical protein
MKKISVSDLKGGETISVTGARNNGLKDGIYTVKSVNNQYATASDEFGMVWTINQGTNISLYEWVDLVKVKEDELEKLNAKVKLIQSQIDKYKKYSSEEEYTASKLVQILSTNNKDISDIQKIEEITKILKSSSETSLL